MILQASVIPESSQENSPLACGRCRRCSSRICCWTVKAGDCMGAPVLYSSSVQSSASVTGNLGRCCYEKYADCSGGCDRFSWSAADRFTSSGKNAQGMPRLGVVGI